MQFPSILVAKKGYGIDEFEQLQKLIEAEQSDLFDVLAYVLFMTVPITRGERVEEARDKIFEGLDEKHKEFLDFVLSKYKEKGVEELSEDKLPVLLNLKDNSPSGVINILGDVESIRSTFFEFQKSLYAKQVSV